jgi:transposase InsO family protein
MTLDAAGRRRNLSFEWGAEQQSSFDELRERMMSEPVVMLPDLDKGHFTLRADASVDGLGAILEQEDPSGVSRPVAYYSKKTTDAERRMDVRTLELLAVVSALDKMYMWLGGAVIDVWTDHASLVYLSESCPVSRRLVRTLDVLQQHRLRWHYVAGTENQAPDALSRREDFVEDDNAENTRVFRRYMAAARRMAEGDTELTDADLVFDGSAFEEEGEGKAGIYPITVLASLTSVQLIPEPQYAEMFREGYRDDPFFAPIQKALRDGERQGPLAVHDNYYEVDGLLYHHHVLYGSRLCVPRGEALNSVLAAAHDDIGHMGVKKTTSALTRVFFPRLRQTVDAYVRGCAACQRAKARHGRKKGELMPLPIPGTPWTDISLDFVGGLPEVYGKNGILTIVDRRSKEVRAVPMRLTDGESNAEAVVDALLEHVYQYTGPFFSIVSDRGTQFTSRLFRDITERLGVSLRMSTAYHPETDGQTERYNKVLAESLRATLNNGDYQWPDVLPFVVYGINSTVHQALGCSPFEASSGRPPLQWLDAIGRPHALDDRDLGDDQATRDAVDRMVQQALEEAQQKYKAAVDVKRRPAPVFKVGQRVMVRSAVLQSKSESELMGHTRKLLSKYIGPLRVVERINASAYRIELPRASKAHDVINVQHLEHYQPSDTFGRKDAPPPVWVAEDGDYYEPDQVLKHRTWSGHGDKTQRVEYLISWVGYGAEENSWLTIAHFTVTV